MAPANATGIVQFKDATTNLGGPVRVINGRAIQPASFLNTGPHSLTAVFTPTNPAQFTPSTSNTVHFTFYTRPVAPAQPPACAGATP